MNNRVYTYTKINELKKAHYFAEIAALPQIVMSLEMASAMCYDMRIFRNNIMGFSGLQKRLFPEWNTSSQRFMYVAMLNQYFRKLIVKAKDKYEKEWLYGCKKNIHMAITNILRLEEAGIRPDDRKEEDRDIRLFLDMWRLLETNDDTIKNFRERSEQLKDPQVFHQEVSRIFRFHGKKKIVWHGFQFFTPMQQYIYDRFVEAGYEIYALISDDERYPYANEIWDYLYKPENGFPKKEQWIRQSQSTVLNPLGEIFETGEPTEASNVKLIKYANTIEFVEDIKRIREDGYYMYCSEDKTANAVLKEYYPEHFELRNLLSYPIGQFIYALHRMWDENLQCIVLNQNGIRKCFASGWLTVNGKSSMFYTDELEHLLPYFDGCYTIDEWRERLAHFAEVYDNAMVAFEQSDTANEKDKMYQNRFGNPLKWMGVFSIDEKRLDAVIQIIQKLLDMAHTLFDKNEPVSIQAHLAKLDGMLYMQEGMPRELYLEEREKVNRIFAAFSGDNGKDYLCYPGDLAAALSSFMRDQLDEEETKNKTLRTLVFNIFQIEAAPITAKGKVHICLADIAKLPGQGGKYNWPLNEELLIKLDKENSYIRNWLEGNRLNALSNRYYIYSALMNDDVEISWIEKQGEKLYAPSPYVTLIDKLSNVKIQESSIRKLDLQTVAGIRTKWRLEKDFDIRENQSMHQYDGEMEYSLCPMRYVYSYVLSDRAAYHNEFQQNIAIVRLIQSLHELLKGQYSFSAIAEQVLELFPNIRKAEKRQLIDNAKNWTMPDDSNSYTNYEEHRYTRQRMNLSFLDPDGFSAAQNVAMRLMSKEGRRGIYHDRKADNDARNCMYCPHSEYCMESLFGIDYKGESEWLTVRSGEQ